MPLIHGQTFNTGVTITEATSFGNGTVVHGDLVIQAGVLTIAGHATVIGDVTILSGATMTHPKTAAIATSLDLHVTGTLTVEPGGQIEADHRSELTTADPNRATTDFNTQGSFYGNSTLGIAPRLPSALDFMYYGNANSQGYHGMVRVYDPASSQYGAICNTGGGSMGNAATVICRQRGYAASSVYSSPSP